MNDVIQSVNFYFDGGLQLLLRLSADLSGGGPGQEGPPTEAAGNHAPLCRTHPARNEEAVICGLIDSIHGQDYPTDLIDIYVIADNCTDSTAARAVGRAPGHHPVQPHPGGQGYALDYAFQAIDRDVGLEHYDAFLVFDADNVLDPGYFTAMNRTFSQGYDIITSYRNSKNYDENWITAGYALWFCGSPGS